MILISTGLWDVSFAITYRHSHISEAWSCRQPSISLGHSEVLTYRWWYFLVSLELSWWSAQIFCLNTDPTQGLSSVSLFEFCFLLPPEVVNVENLGRFGPIGFSRLVFRRPTHDRLREDMCLVCIASLNRCTTSELIGTSYKTCGVGPYLKLWKPNVL